MPGFSPGSADWGLTADAVLALAAGGRTDEPPTATAIGQLRDHVASYVTWDDLGPTYSGVRLAGPLGKLLLAAVATGNDPNAFGGWDLEAETRSTMQTTGAQAGRFSDINPYSTDTSNGFGQALVMLGLSYTAGGVPTQAVTFLLAQQCPSGGFRLFYATGTGCTDDASADSDTTALALQALLSVDPTPDTATAVDDAVTWLASRQLPDGAWGGTGPTAAANSNSTGIITQALRAAGRTDLAELGAAWIAGVQISPEVTGPASTDGGAIAYNPATHTAALASGIPPFQRDQWRRATTQAVLGLGLPAYGAIGDEPVTPTTTTTVVMATTTSVPSPTTTVMAPTTTHQAAGGMTTAAGNPTDNAGTQGGATLPATGADSGVLTIVAVALLATGSLLVRSTRHRTNP